MNIAETTHTRPVPPPARGWAALGTWFEATTPHGPLRLYLGEAVGPAPHAAAAALALQRGEPMVAALDDWLRDPPAWRWRPEPAPISSTDVRLPWRDSCHQLIGTWPWLRSLQPPPDQLATRLQWPAVEAVLSAARLHLSADDLDQIEPGGAVLLPPSMKPDWTGRLRCAAEPSDAGVKVDLRDPSSPRVLAGPMPPPEPANPAAGRPCEVRLQLAHAIPADRLAGWHQPSLADAILSDLPATLWQLPAAREPARCLAHGRLIPWGDGWALALQGLGDPEQTHVRPA
ncbi:hypothetical protein HLB44_09660 [Aquincola sp. S2]|uniref:Uncharacterized protein n=1 Tax=Pseudaquabacterium terrae TaxID=2732868 RepID=A0ABX2EF53_9BURK|nr:hypothetical protein [Aquabacterium terrae]NRF67248.1 hypothetical protein [Aquabacterium terrae]